MSAPSLEEVEAFFRRAEQEIEFRRPATARARSGKVPPHAEREAWAKQADAIRLSIEHAIVDLKVRLGRLPALQAMATYTVLLMGDSETYRESEQERPALSAEYPAWLYLTMSPPPALEAERLDSRAFEEALELSDGLIRAARYYFMARGHAVADTEEGVSLEELRFRVRTWNLDVRAPAYEGQEQEQLRALFEPFAGELIQATGFEVEGALSMISGFDHLVHERIHAIFQEVAEVRNRWHAAIDDAEAFASLDAEESEIVERLRTFESPEASIDALAMSWAESSWHQAFLVTAAEVADAAAMAEETALAALQRLSSGFERKDPAGGWPSTYDDLELHPIIALDDGNFFSTLLWKHLWALRPMLEHALVGAGAWDRYQEHRARYLESRSVKLLAGASSHARAWTSLKYRAADSGIEYELDGLVLVDTVAILVEAKAGAMSSAGRRGAPSGFDEDLERLVGEPETQVIRGARFIVSRDEATFQAGRERVSVRRDSLSRVVLVTTTLESLSAFVVRLQSLRDAGRLSSLEIAWAVNVLDLEIVADLLGDVGGIVHYIDRRLRAEQRDVRAPEELDYLGHYLKRGLYFEEREPEVETVFLSSFTEPLDDFYLHQEGWRKKAAPKPGRRLNDLLRELVDRLNAAGPRGFVEATVAIYELGSEAQDQLAEMISLRRERAKEGMFAAARMMFGDTLLGYVAVPEGPLEPPMGFMQAAKYDAKARRGIVIAESMAQPGSVVVAFEQSKWQLDADMELAAAGILSKLQSTVILRREA